MRVVAAVSAGEINGDSQETIVVLRKSRHGFDTSPTARSTSREIALRALAFIVAFDESLDLHCGAVKRSPRVVNQFFVPFWVVN